MGNPESKVKISEIKVNTGRVVTNNSNTEVTDLFRRFKNYKKPTNGNENKLKDEEKAMIIKIKKRKTILPLENNVESHLKQCNNIILNLLPNHLNKYTNLNFFLSSNLSSSNNLIHEFHDSKQKILDNLTKTCSYLNSVIELNNSKSKNKKINLNTINNQDISYFEMYSEIEKNINLLKEKEEINNKNFSEINSNASLANNFITSPEKILKISKDENEETIKSQSTRNNESLNLNTTSNSSKKEVKVVKIGSKKEMLPRTKSTDKMITKNMTPIIKKINKSPVKNFRQVSPPSNKINKSSILDKSDDKNMDRSTITNKSVIGIKEVPKMVLKINLKQKKNSLAELDKSTSEFQEYDSSRYIETIKKPSLNNTSINSANQFSPKIFLNQNSKGSSLSTIRIENNSNSNTIKSISELDIPRAPVGLGSYVDRAKKQSLFQENSSKSPSRKQSFSKELNKINTIKFTGKSKELGLNKSSDDIFIIDDSFHKKNNLLRDNVHYKKSSIEEGTSSNLKTKMMFKIDLSEQDEEIEKHNKKPEKISTREIPKTPKDKKNSTLTKLNKLKNIKSYLEKKAKPKELEDDYMQILHTEPNNFNNLDIIRESITHENDETENGRFSFQRRATPKFDRLNCMNQNHNEGERFSFNIFDKQNRNPNNFNSENVQVRYNFDIDTNIDENDLKDVYGIDNEDGLENI
jgi:hypothetical protein